MIGRMVPVPPGGVRRPAAQPPDKHEDACRVCLNPDGGLDDYLPRE